MEMMDKCVWAWMLNTSQSPDLLKLMHLRAYPHLCLDLSLTRLRIRPFVGREIVVWGMGDFRACSLVTGAPITLLACDILVSILIELFSKLVIVEPCYLNCLIKKCTKPSPTVELGRVC
eukprot:scaffold199073_cov26-Attheya_sp.AAC.1